MPGLNQMLDSFMVRAANGPLHQFTFRTGYGFRGRDVEMILRDHGIKVFERVKLGRGELAFSVRQDQAEWAEYLLCRARVPLTCELLDPDNEILLNGGEKPRRSFLERLVNALARFTGG